MTDIFTVRQMAERHPAFSENSLRYHIFHSESNKLNKALIRVGRKVLIKEPAFLEWLDSQSQGGAA
jgi:hypothetical protein